MRLMLRFAMLLLLAVTGVVEAAAAERCNDSHEVVTESLRDNMIGKARLNGEVVTGVLLKEPCSSGFSTRSGVTWIDWTPIDNIYPSGSGNVLILQIPRNGRVDVVTYEGDPDVGRRIDMSLGLLQADCHDHGRFC